MSGSASPADLRPDERFRQAVDVSPAGVLLVDPTGRILLVNRQVESWFGYRREELIGELVEILIPERYRSAHTGQRAEYVRQPEIRQMGSGRELRARRKDGSEFPCDISLHPLSAADGLELMVHIVDTTERRRLEHQRMQEEAHRRLRFMVDNLPAGAVYVSEGTFVVNRAAEAITGYGAGELTTLDHWFSALFPRQQAEVQARYLADRAARFPQTRTWELTRRDGQTRWVEQTAFRDDLDEVWLLHDITDQMRAQQQILQAERLAAIGQMMTALAHESRNALQRAQACLEMLELDLEDRPELLNLARRAQIAVDELQRLYEEVRGYASPLALELREWNLQAVCDEVWSNLTPARGEKQIKFESAAQGPPPVCRVDRHRFGQVLRNILDNSISVLPQQGGHITVRYEAAQIAERPGLRMRICDNGPGLNAEQRARIFEPFFTTKSRGTGLGMAIAKRIMEAHGGEIAIGNAASGTEIVLSLPL